MRRLCQALGVLAGGFCAGQQDQQEAVGHSAPVRETALVKVFGVHQRRYGTRRLQVALRQKRLWARALLLALMLGRQERL